MQMLYLIGEPGIGKTTLLRQLLVKEHYHLIGGRVPYQQYEGGVVLGVPRPGGFAGTDGYAMDIQPHVLEWLRTERPPVVLGEGDRLSNERFFAAVEDIGYELTVAALVGGTMAADNRAKRSQVTGKVQNEQWVRGRGTKVANLVMSWATPGHIYQIDKQADYGVAFTGLKEHPVLRALRRAW